MRRLRVKSVRNGQIYLYDSPHSPWNADYGILISMKTKNMREMEKMWAKKATEKNNPGQKPGTPTRQSPSHTTRAARKSSRGR